MNFGDIVGQLLQQGVGGQTQNRLENALGQGGLGGLLGGAQSGGGGGIASALGGLLGGSGGQSSGGIGNLLGGLGGMLGGGQGGVSGAQAGGIGALAGALLGGGGGAVKGALGGSAMAVLGALAVAALKNWQGGQTAGAQASGITEAEPMGQLSEDELQQMVAPQTAELCLKAMIAAAKSDGQIQDDEMQRIVGKLNEGGVTDQERQFVLEEMRKPLDVQALVSSIPNPQVGAQVYAAALMAISVDTANEQAFMQQLAAGAGLDQGAQARLHQMVGAPAM